MITDSIINVLLFIPYLLLEGLNSFEFNLTFPDNMFEIIKDITCGVAYVIPIARLMPIFTVRIAILILKISWASVCRIKSFIPGYSN